MLKTSHEVDLSHVLEKPQGSLVIEVLVPSDYPQARRQLTKTGGAGGGGGFWVWGFGFGVEGLGFRVEGGCAVSGPWDLTRA